MPLLADERVLTNCKILLVDDTDDFRLLYKRFFSKKGATVDEAVNGEKAVNKTMSDKYDAIIMDLTMPVMDGYEAASAIRMFGYLGPIIAMSAYDESLVRDKCLEAGFSICVSKFIDKEELINTLISQMLMKKGIK